MIPNLRSSPFIIFFCRSAGESIDVTDSLLAEAKLVLKIERLRSERSHYFSVLRSMEQLCDHESSSLQQLVMEILWAFSFFLLCCLPVQLEGVAGTLIVKKITDNTTPHLVIVRWIWTPLNRCTWSLVTQTIKTQRASKKTWAPTLTKNIWDPRANAGTHPKSSKLSFILN